MKRVFAIVLAVCMLWGCSAKEDTQETEATQQTLPAETVPVTAMDTTQIPYVSRFDTLTHIELSDTALSVNGAGETDTVYTSRDIIYYEDKTAYESGNPYGEGESHERHTAEEADMHTVVNITAPGAYRVTGKLSRGQIRVDLGATAYDDPDAVVELILCDADITCTVAPAIVFMNVYECDGDWSADAPKQNVDTTAAGANLILEGENAVAGSHVAKIFKDQEEEKKLWKQDGAVYSYMSMNVYGPGKLDITADNEGMDTELHLTVNGGRIAIRSQDDGINTNEDGVSVTTINGGDLHIIAGLGAEGDGIDSNGYLVINGGVVVASANPGADAGLDADLGSFVNGGTVVALGSTMDWAESNSGQVTMNLQFASNQSAEAAIVVTRQDGTVIFAYDPGEDEVLAENKRVYSGAILSCANFHVGETYQVYVDGELTGADTGGVYDPTTVTSYTGGSQMAYTGTDVTGRPGGMGFGGGRGKDFDDSGLPEGQRPSMPANMDQEAHPQPGDGIQQGQRPGREDSEAPTIPEGMVVPENFDPSAMEDRPDGDNPMEADRQSSTDGQSNTLFYMQDMVNFFSGLTNA